jgi:arginyl-tRNA synthetase
LITDQLTAAVRAALTAVGVTPPAVIGLERPARREHGDWSTNVALASAKAAGRNPRELAAALVAELQANPPAHVTYIDVAGPGFINFRLADTWLHEVLRDVVAGGVAGYARFSDGAGVRMNVEFVSANPTGPLHAGHARGACYGDAVARLLERLGHPVAREFYVNDRGAQLQTFAASLAARARGEEPPEDGYQGHYVTEWAGLMPAGADPAEWGRDYAMEHQRAVLARLGVVFDTWFSERSMVASGAIEQTLAELRERDVVYEAEGAVWLRSTDFGDDKDRVLVRSDGEPTYVLPDIAYHRDKFRRADHLVNVLGADHHGYVGRMKAAMAALGENPDELDLVITQLVRLERDGQEVRLSKRAGDIIELAEIIDEIGADAARFTYLLQSVDTSQVFDLGLAASTAMDNPVFYVQMAHARLCSIQAKAADAGVTRAPLGAVDLAVLADERELDVLRVLFELPEVIHLAATELAPHKVTTWLRELAGAVHRFYHECYVLGEGIAPELTQARLWLVEAARIGLVIGLDVLGVSAPERMD